MILFLIGFVGLQFADGLIMGHPMEFWDSADIILDGTVLSTTNIDSENLVQHDVKVEQYFKNPKPQQMITVYGPTAFNEDWFYPKFFEKGQRALFYLKKVDDKYIILEHSREATEDCDPRDMIGLSTLPSEPPVKDVPTLFFDPYQTCNGYLFSPQYLKETLSPLKQFRSGIPFDEINCKDGHVVAIKNSNGNPACVKPETKTRLMERGWAEPLGDVVFQRPSTSSTYPNAKPLKEGGFTSDPHVVIPWMFMLELEKRGIEYENAPSSQWHGEEDLADPAKVCSPIITSNGTKLYISAIFHLEPLEITGIFIDSLLPEGCQQFWNTDIGIWN